jgi:hypothetical protein
MASNMALKRAAKANRRKAAVAEKRKLEISYDSLTARVLRAAQAPIRYCLVPQTLFDNGIGTVILARGISAHHFTVGVFLVDTWRFGVKDAFFRSVDAETLEIMIANLKITNPMASAAPSYARKLLRDAAAWSASIGVAPHRDFAAVERLFGDVKADESDATFRFGRQGEPIHVEDLRQSTTQGRLRFGGLGAALGD